MEPTDHIHDAVVASRALHCAGVAGPPRCAAPLAVVRILDLG